MSAQKVAEGSNAALFDDEDVDCVNDLTLREIDEDLGGDAGAAGEERSGGAGARTRSFNHALIEFANRLLAASRGAESNQGCVIVK